MAHRTSEVNPLANSFGPFLESLGKYEKENVAQQQPAPQRINPVELKLLHILGDSKPRSVAELMREHRIPLQEGSAAITALREGQFVEVTGDAGAEQIRITERGLAAESLAN